MTLITSSSELSFMPESVRHHEHRCQQMQMARGAYALNLLSFTDMHNELWTLMAPQGTADLAEAKFW